MEQLRLHSHSLTAGSGSVSVHVDCPEMVHVGETHTSLDTESADLNFSIQQENTM